jgi:hypothetical protein
VASVRNWLRAESGRSHLPGPAALNVRYENFKRDLPQICVRLDVQPAEMTFVDFCHGVADWLEGEKKP